MASPTPPSGGSSAPAPSAAAAPPSNNATLHLVVKTMKGASFDVRIPRANATVDDLHRAVLDAQDIPVAHQRLIYKGKVLKAEKKIDEYKMDDGDCLHLIVKSGETAGTATGAAASTAAGGAATSAMPSLTPNNTIPTVPPPPFAFPPLNVGPAGATTFQMHFGPPVVGGVAAGTPAGTAAPGAAGANAGAGPGAAAAAGALPGAVDLGVLMNQMLGGLGGLLAGGQVPGAAGMPPGSNIVIDIVQQPGGGLQQTIRRHSASMPGAGVGGGTGAAAGAASTTPAAGAAPTVTNRATPAAATAISPSSTGTQPSPSPPPPAAAAGAGVGSGVPLVPLVPNVQFQMQAPPMHPQSHPALSVNAVRAFLTQVAEAFPRMTAAQPLAMDPRATMSSSALQQGAFPETLAGMAQLLAQTQAALTQVAPPLLHRLTNEVQNLTTPVSSSAASEAVAQRLALQNQLRMVAPGLRRIGDSLRGLATLLEAIQVNPATGEASLLVLPPHLQPGRQVNITHAPPLTFGQMQQQQQQSRTNTTAPPAVATPATPAAVIADTTLPPSTPFSDATSTAPASTVGVTPPGTPVNLAAVLPPILPPIVPLFGGASAAAPTTSANNAPTSATPTTAPAAPAAAADLQPSAPQSQQAAAPAAIPAAADPMAGIMSALGPMFANLQAQAVGPNANAATAPTSAGAGAPQPGVPNFAAMFSSLMPMVGQIVQGATQAAAGNQDGTAGGVGAGAPNLQGLLSGLMGSLGNALAHPPQASAPSAAADSSSAVMDVDSDDDQDHERASLFDMVLSTCLQHLALPDMLAFVQGDWRGLERVHAPLRELIMDLLAEDATDANRELLSHSFASGIVDSLLDDAALASVANQRIQDGPDPRRVSAPIVRTHVRRLIDLILDTSVADVPPSPAPLPPAMATSFSTRVKSWCTDFLGELLVALATCYRDGLASAQRLTEAIVSARLSTVGGGAFAMFMPMLSGSLGQVMMRAAQDYQQRRLLGTPADGAQAAWLQHVPTSERARWQTTIEADEKALQAQLAATSSSSSSSTERTLFRPLSNAYRSGLSGAAKKSSAAASGESQAASAPAAASNAASSPAPSNIDDTRLSEQLRRTLQRAIEVTQPASATSPEEVQRILASLPPSLEDAYVRQVASDLRASVQHQFAGDYNAERYPTIARTLAP